MRLMEQRGSSTRRNAALAMAVDAVRGRCAVRYAAAGTARQCGTAASNRASRKANAIVCTRKVRRLLVLVSHRR